MARPFSIQMDTNSAKQQNARAFSLRAHTRTDQKDQGRQGQQHRHPFPQHQSRSARTEKQELEMRNVFRNAAVKNRKQLHQDQKDMGTESIGNDQGQFPDRFPAGIKSGQFLERQHKKNQQSRARSKSRRQKTGRKHRRHPERSRRKARSIGKP